MADHDRSSWHWHDSVERANADLHEVITGQLEPLTVELTRQRREMERWAENQEIRTRNLEQKLDEPLSTKAWRWLVLSMLLVAVVSVAACLGVAVWWVLT